MVRVGGGWCALDEFLVKNDPCRGEYRVPSTTPGPATTNIERPISIDNHHDFYYYTHQNCQKCHITHYNLATKQIGIYIYCVGVGLRVQSSLCSQFVENQLQMFAH